MNIKKFIAPSMAEAMKKVKSELGENAVILQSKAVYRGGFLGVFKKKKFEVIAAIEEYPLEHQTIHAEEPKSFKLPPQSKGRDKTAAESNPFENREVISEIKKLKNELTLLRHQQHEFIHYPNEIQICLSVFKKIGIDQQYINELAEYIMDDWRSSSHPLKKQDVLQSCHTFFKKSLQGIPHKGITYKKKFVHFVGPTGVGKTTTIAKLAADAVLKQHKKVAFMTTDTYRIAAIEQLRTYAELLHVPVEIIYSQEDFQAAAEKYADYDLVFIDTAGRNYRNMQFVQELQQLVQVDHDFETFLVISVSMKEQDISEIIDNFLELQFDQFIFSKADETSSYGMMYNLLRKYKIGVGYITTGQEVPDDIVRADTDLIIQYLMKDEIS